MVKAKCNQCGHEFSIRKIKTRKKRECPKCRSTDITWDSEPTTNREDKKSLPSEECMFDILKTLMEMKVLMESIQKTLSNMESKLTVSTPEKRKTAEPITKEHDEKTTEPKPTASPTATPKKQNTTKPYTEQDAIDELNRDYEESQREFTEEDKRNYIRDAARKLGFPEKEIDEELGKSND